MKRKSVLQHRSEFLSPIRLIRNKQFSKRDVAQIKNNIAFTTSIIRFIVACFLFVFATVMMIMMGFATNWKQVEIYGVGSLLAQIGEMCCCLVTIILLIIAYFSKSTNKIIILNRIAAYFLFIGISLQMLFGIYADAQMGFTTEKESLSASIIFLAALLVVQPAYWLDATLLDSAATIATICLSIFCGMSFGMQAIHYYIVISLAFPLCCYVINTLLFYAEFQHYKEILENDRLTNKAYYDNLTHCKNRHSLNVFLTQNIPNLKLGEGKHLLLVMFDIDNFKEYNDSFSHLGGDYCLKTISDGIRKAFPSPSLDFFRYGGEEFLLFFELDNDKEAPAIMEKVRNAIVNLNIEAPEGAPCRMVTISVGGTIVTDLKHFNFEESLAIADKNLYNSKNNGKNICSLDGSII